IVRRPLSEIRHAPARYHGLSRRAAFIDARAADVLALDQGGLPAGLRQGRGERSASLSGTDDNGPILFRSAHWSSNYTIHNRELSNTPKAIATRSSGIAMAKSGALSARTSPTRA